MRSILLFVLIGVSAAVSAQSFKLYGLTANGGASGFGVLYTTRSDNSGYQVLHSFDGGAGGARPYGGLAIAGTKLYGTTKEGGGSGLGTIFSFDTVSQVFAKVADFTGSNGAGPQGDLTFYNGKLYGVAPLGGVSNGGTIFVVDPVAGTLTDLFNLNNSTGTNPYGNITLFNDKLYFVASLGGSGPGGSIAVFDPAAGTCNALYNFPVFTFPHSGMVVLNDLLYGTQIWNGGGTGGFIFSFDPAAVTFTDVHDFSQANFEVDVENPNGLSVSNGVLYGSGQNGVIEEDGGGWFSFDPVANNFLQIRWFSGTSIDGPSDGSNPLAAPISVPDGAVVGAVPFSGDHYDGSIIFNTSGGGQMHHSFTGADGQQPMFGSLFLPSNAVPLPIRILRFSGLLTDAGRVLSWMASETAQGGWFQLQRSVDEVNFMPVDSVGALVGTASYSYTDDASLPGVKVLYYRLKMTDENGVASYSQIVAIGLGGAGGDSLRLINTVVTGTVFLQYSSGGSSTGPAVGSLDVRVVDVKGMLWVEQVLPVYAGVNGYSIDASALPKGMYVLRAAGKSFKFMKL